MSKLCKGCEARKTLLVSTTTQTGINWTWLHSPKGEEALLLMEAWIQLAPEGKTDWPTGKLLQAMRDVGFLVRDPGNFTKFLHRHYGEAYGRAVKGAAIKRRGRGSQ